MLEVSKIEQTSTLSHRFSSAKRSYKLTIALIGALLIGLVGLIGFQTYVPVEYITRDPAAIAGHPIYYGAISNLGILLWSASVTACLLGSIIVKILKDCVEAASFFLAFGSLSFVLCMDDLFLLHEDLFPRRLNLPEEVTFLAYAIAVSAVLFRFRKFLLKNQPALFGTALLLFAFSLSSDLIFSLFELEGGAAYAIEDGFKLIAIFAWCSYFLWAAIDQITTASIIK